MSHKIKVDGKIVFARKYGSDQTALELTEKAKKYYDAVDHFNIYEYSAPSGNTVLNEDFDACDSEFGLFYALRGAEIADDLTAAELNELLEAFEDDLEAFEAENE